MTARQGGGLATTHAIEPGRKLNLARQVVGTTAGEREARLVEQQAADHRFAVLMADGDGTADRCAISEWRLERLSEHAVQP